jgi:hypothetical protein
MMLPAITSRLGLAIAAPLAGAALALPNPQPAQAAPAASPEVTVASSTEHDLRFVVTATKTSSGAAPTATAHVSAYVRTASGWRYRGELRLGARDGFYWKVLDGGHAVREFSVSNTSPGGGSVRLIVTPALGSSPTYHFKMADGHLVG